MLFTYKAINKEGKEQVGDIDAINRDSAISSLQQRGMVVVSVADSMEEKNIFKRNIAFFDKVSLKDTVMMSRQLAALFEAQVSAVKAFTLLGNNSENAMMRRTLNAVATDIKGGVSMSQSMAQYPEVFTAFYTNMVKAGEESGKLTETFLYLADYLERSYELTSRTQNALVYPAFVVVTFVVVVVLMLTMVIPRLSEILLETGQDLPFYTKITIGLSEFFVNYGLFLLILIVIAGVFLWRSTRTESGRAHIDKFKVDIPYFGKLFRMVYLSRIADNMHTMLSAGIPVVRALEITRDVVGNRIFGNIIDDAVESVKGGESISRAFGKNKEIPAIMVQMIQVGEETGSLGDILETLSRFYKREVNNTVDTLIGLIEPAMIVGLGVSVGFLITSILLPIYNIAGSL